MICINCLTVGKKTKDKNRKNTDLGIWSPMNRPWGISYINFQDNFFICKTRVLDWVKYISLTLKSHSSLLKNMWKLRSPWVTVLLLYVDWTHIHYCREKKFIFYLWSVQSLFTHMITSELFIFSENCSSQLSCKWITSLENYLSQNVNFVLGKRRKNIFQYLWLGRKAACYSVKSS